MMFRPRRSVLYVPGSNARAIAKSRTLDADALVFDLEDSVAPTDKTVARSSVVAAVAQGGFRHLELVVRINGLDTQWGRDDLLAKVAAPGDVMFVAADLAKAGVADTVRLWAMVETPAAVLHVADLARTAADPASRLDVLVLGTNDLAKDLRIRVGPRRESLVVWLSTCVAAARCFGLDILDGVFNGLDDPEGLAEEARQGRDFGMDGKTCIHPDQIEICNAVFAPQPDEVVWARRIVAAFDGPEGASNVLRLDDRMVERLHAESARRLLAIDDTLGARRRRGDAARL